LVLNLLMERYFQISFYALILTAFVALAETGRLDIPSVLVFLVALAFIVRREFSDGPPLLAPRGAFFLSLGYIFFFVVDAIILSRSFVSAIIHMVLFLELAKLAQKKADKDYLYLMMLAFLQVLAASSLTIDMSFVLTLLFFLLALVSTLMSFDIVRSQRAEKAWTGPAINTALGGMSVWVSVWIVLFGVLLFFMIPRIGTGYFSRAATQALLISGFNESVELGEIGQVKRSTALVMRTRLLEGTSSAVPKWRGIALDRFDGHTWSLSSRRRRQIPRTRTDVYAAGLETGSGDRVRFEIFLEPLATTTLFGPHAVLEVEGGFRGGLETDSDDAIHQRTPASRRILYEVDSEIPVRNTADPILNRVMPDEFDVSDRYLQLPEDLDPQIVQLAQQVTAAGATIVEKAALLETYLKREYTYSLDLTWDPGLSPLSTFLFDARSGHCEYFASSMAIMLRTVGIPTRMVNGFLAGEYNAVGGSYIIRQSDAHSWVEVYVPGRGWIDFDPTAPDPNRGETSLITLLSHYMDAADLFWNSYVLTYDTDTQLQLFRSAQDMALDLQRELRARSDQWIMGGQLASDRMSARVRQIVETAAFWITLAVLALGVIAVRNRRALSLKWKLWNLRRGRGSADADVVGALFYRAAAMAGDRKHRRLPHETWREWLGRLPDTDRRTRITDALGIFEKARYGPAPITPDEFTQLQQTVDRLRHPAR
jgi:transglutaminase-like putative cysteine protease